jgi:hypothetical protein
MQNIVLVHGNLVDGSGWLGVSDHLTADGCRIAVVQNPTLSLGGRRRLQADSWVPAAVVAFDGAVINLAGARQAVRVPGRHRTTT